MSAAVHDANLCRSTRYQLYSPWCACCEGPTSVYADQVIKQCMAVDSHLTLTLGGELGVIDLGITEPLASVGGCIELRLAVTYDVQGLALCFGPEYGEQLLLLRW